MDKRTDQLLEILVEIYNELQNAQKENEYLNKVFDACNVKLKQIYVFIDSIKMAECKRTKLLDMLGSLYKF